MKDGNLYQRVFKIVQQQFLLYLKMDIISEGEEQTRIISRLKIQVKCGIESELAIYEPRVTNNCDCIYKL